MNTEGHSACFIRPSSTVELVIIEGRMQFTVNYAVSGMKALPKYFREGIAGSLNPPQWDGGRISLSLIRLGNAHLTGFFTCGTAEWRPDVVSASFLKCQCCHAISWYVLDEKISFSKSLLLISPSYHDVCS
jgi:hypothetical protein